MKIFTIIFSLFFSYTIILGQNIVLTEIMYNSPASDDIEFLEFYNADNETVNLAGWRIGDGIEYTFPNTNLASGEYLVITNDSTRFVQVFNFSVREWTDGTLSNGGEMITLIDDSGNLIDSVSYDDNDGWSTTADSEGASLVLCDPLADNNDPANWQRGITTVGFGFIEDCQEVFANPGGPAICLDEPIVSFLNACQDVREDADTIMIELIIDNPSDESVMVDISIDENSTATSTTDFEILSATSVEFSAQSTDRQLFSLKIIDDNIVNEINETLILKLSLISSNAVIATKNSTITIIDNDIELSKNLILTGVFDGPLSGGFPKGVELYAATDINNLGIYSLGSANNGNGTDNAEFDFPPRFVPAGTYLYVTNDSAGFANYFGFYNEFVFVDDENPVSTNINGDDAFELFEQQLRIDNYGYIDVDGTDTNWEYTDSWAYRNDGTGPDSIFVEEHWRYNETDILDDSETNAEAEIPFPIGTYVQFLTTIDDSIFVEFNEPFTFDVLQNDRIIGNVVTMTIIQNGNIGTAIINNDLTITYTPNPNRCGKDELVYSLCNEVSCDTANIYVEVNCMVPTSEPEWIHEIRVYPNPVQDILYYELPKSIQEIELVNLLGQIVVTQNVEEQQSSLPLQEIENGIYYLRFKSDNTYYTKSLLILR